MHANQLKSKSQKPNFYFYTTASLSKLGSAKKSNVIVAFSVYLPFSKSDVRFMIRTKCRCCCFSKSDVRFMIRTKCRCCCFSKSDVRFMIRTKWRCCRKKKFMIINQFVEFDISSLFL